MLVECHKLIIYYRNAKNWEHIHYIGSKVLVHTSRYIMCMHNYISDI